MSENVPPIAHRFGDHADLSGQSCERSLHAALENVLRIVGEPYDYDFLMGVSGHAFRLMIHQRGVYIEPPHDGESHYFRYHTLPAIGYAQKAGSRFCCDGGEHHPGSLASAEKQSLARGMPVLVCHPFPDWGVIVGHDQDGYAVNTYGGKIIRTPEPGVDGASWRRSPISPFGKV